jgi:hypothetical protein
MNQQDTIELTYKMVWSEGGVSRRGTKLLRVYLPDGQSYSWDELSSAPIPGLEYRGQCSFQSRREVEQQSLRISRDAPLPLEIYIVRCSGGEDDSSVVVARSGYLKITVDEQLNVREPK